jgi:hypothetical protein
MSVSDIQTEKTIPGGTNRKDFAPERCEKQRTGKHECHNVFGEQSTDAPGATATKRCRIHSMIQTICRCDVATNCLPNCRAASFAISTYGNLSLPGRHQVLSGGGIVLANVSPYVELLNVLGLF